MRIDFLSRFDRAFKKLEIFIQKEVRKSIEFFIQHLQKGQRPQGLGLRRLRGSIWEIRSGIKIRIIFELKKDWITFLFVGNHDEVSRFLKNQN